MDTDGTVDTRGGCEFTQTNERLAKQVYKLIQSLGMRATLTHKTKTGYIKKDGTEADTWRIYFTASKEVPVFKLKRKFDRLPEHPKKSTDRKAIINIEISDKFAEEAFFYEHYHGRDDKSEPYRRDDELVCNAVRGEREVFIRPARPEKREKSVKDIHS